MTQSPDWPGLRDWASLLSYELVYEDRREHPDGRATVWRLRGPAGDAYLKAQSDRDAWAAEVCAYRQWAPAFGRHAPRLIAVHDAEPLAMIVSALPGHILEGLPLPEEQERQAWRTAGQALATLHSVPVHGSFGPASRDETPSGQPVADAILHLTAEFDDWTRRGRQAARLDRDELAIIGEARALLPAFAGERPTPCHRDYCPANWLIDETGAWSGVIDFEFARRDVRAADFSRYPAWEWIERPALTGALLEGYACLLPPPDETQLLVSRALYALGAIVWGGENAYHVFAAEGRRALRRVSELLRRG